MSGSSARRGAPPRGDADPEELLAWCLATADLMAFRDALRRVPAERWPEIHERLLERLGRGDGEHAGGDGGNAAFRDRRGRAAARAIKLDILQQQAGSRSSIREANDRAARRARAAESDPAPEPDVE